MEVVGQQNSLMEEHVRERKGERLPFQIFPEPVEVVGGTEVEDLGWREDSQASSLQQKERLPSIVVEPTELSEVESGELRWPPEDLDFQDEDEDLFLEQCIPPANIADWGEDEQEEEEEDSIIAGDLLPSSPIEEDFRDEPASTSALH